MSYINLQEHLEDARRRYPIGTVFKCSFDGATRTIKNNSPRFICNDTSIVFGSDIGSVWLEGTWAEIINKVESQIINTYDLW